MNIGHSLMLWSTRCIPSACRFVRLRQLLLSLCRIPCLCSLPMLLCSGASHLRVSRAREVLTRKHERESDSLLFRWGLPRYYTGNGLTKLFIVSNGQKVMVQGCSDAADPKHLFSLVFADRVNSSPLAASSLHITGYSAPPSRTVPGFLSKWQLRSGNTI